MLGDLDYHSSALTCVVLIGGVLHEACQVAVRAVPSAMLRNKILCRVRESWHNISNTQSEKCQAPKDNEKVEVRREGYLLSLHQFSAVETTPPRLSAICRGQHALIRAGRITYRNVLAYQYQ